MAKDDYLRTYGRIILLVVDVIICLFFFPVLMLLLVQVKNLLINKTTYERIRGNRSSTSVREQLRGRRSGLSLKNCQTMCGNTR